MHLDLLADDLCIKPLNNLNLVPNNRRAPKDITSNQSLGRPPKSSRRKIPRDALPRASSEVEAVAQHLLRRIQPSLWHELAWLWKDFGVMVQHECAGADAGTSWNFG